MDGIDGIHCHMTNSLNTPIEALEYAYPFRVRSLWISPRIGRAAESFAAATDWCARSNFWHRRK